MRPRDPDQWETRTIEKYWRSRSLELRPDAAFFEVADPIVMSKRTLLGYDRLYALWQAIRNVAGIDGSVAEIGSYRGGSAFFIASAFVEMTGDRVPMHVFDTFEGHPEQAITQHDPHQQPGQFGATRYEDVCAYLAGFEHVQVQKGDIAAILPALVDTTYRLVHIDTDLYQPTVVCLEYFGRRMARGGVIVVDDYASQKCSGVAKAVSEYLEGTDAFQAWDLRTEQLILVHR
jgi:hypothetical protein